jgi:ATP-binding cassette subfamily G (WHITE) protein 2
MSVTILPITLEVARLFGGFFLPPINLPAYFKWLDALSYAKYAYTGISLINELTGLVITCAPEDLAKNNGVCPITSGEQTINSLGLSYISITGAALVLVAFIVFCRAGYLGIRYIKW